MLAARLPVDVVLVRELDVKRSRLDTVAIGVANRNLSVEAGSTECSPEQLRRLLGWCRRGEIAHRRSGATVDGAWALCIPPGVPGEVLVGPLDGGHDPAAVLVVVGRARTRLQGRHVALVRALLDPLAVALENHHRLHELQALREAAEAEKQALLTRLGRTQVATTIVGADSGLKPVMERIELVARADVPVLIFGETGSGKEVMARALHAQSPRSAGPFIRVNCGAIPPDLIDSQLFGHERGSFTGATDTRKGWFERADGGTLFLDEIGELPLAVQVRLLRVLQDGSLERIGGQAPITVDTRIVAATHRDLTAMIRAGRFREDLWYRIAVFPVLLPPLRARAEDIPALARHFAERAAVRFGLPVRMPSPTDIAALVAYPWPGNIRELGTVIDRAVILGNGDRLEVTTALGVVTGSPIPATDPTSSLEAHRAAVVPLDEAIRRHLDSALASTAGRVEGRHGAAALLRVNPHTLRARMRKLGLDWTRFRGRT